jgi:CRP-like cAMP-binding protein
LLTSKKNLSRLKAVRSFFNDNNGPLIQNTILLGLPAKERNAVFSKLELAELPKHKVLNEVEEPIQFGYFINSGLVSLLSVMSDGKSVEVGLAGKEGFIGLPLVANFETSPTRVVMQVEGSGFRISPAHLNDALRNCPTLNKSLQRLSQVMTMQATQIAACNRLHEVDHRLARWLLMSQDRLGGNVVRLTQESLASMLGTRRASVTEAAGILQKAGLIAYRRGEVKIEDRRRLEKAACECYGALVRQSHRWQHEARSKFVR